MKKVGIVADKYKIEKFKQELTKKGFIDFTLTPFVSDTTTITVNVKDEDVDEVRKICQLVEMYFKRSN